MKRIGLAGSILVAALAISAMAAVSASAAPPEFGRCIKVAPKTGEYMGAQCTSPGGSRSYDWVAGAGEKKKLHTNLEEPVFTSTGKSKTTITCAFGEAEAEYTGPKTVTVKSLILNNCKTPEEPLFKSFCQNLAAFRGEISMNELAGELGYIKATTQVGLDLKPLSGSSLALFECGGAQENTEKGMGTGTFREFQGSVIGRIAKVNKMTLENSVKYQVKRGVQVPEQFEGGSKDTLTTLVGLTEKTPEPTLYSDLEAVINEEPMEVKAK